MNDDPVDASAKLVSIHYQVTGREYVGALRHGGGMKAGLVGSVLCLGGGTLILALAQDEGAFGAAIAVGLWVALLYACMYTLVPWRVWRRTGRETLRVDFSDEGVRVRTPHSDSVHQSPVYSQPVESLAMYLFKQGKYRQYLYVPKRAFRSVND